MSVIFDIINEYEEKMQAEIKRLEGELNYLSIIRKSLNEHIAKLKEELSKKDKYIKDLEGQLGDLDRTESVEVVVKPTDQEFIKLVHEGKYEPPIY